MWWFRAPGLVPRSAHAQGPIVHAQRRVVHTGTGGCPRRRVGLCTWFPRTQDGTGVRLATTRLLVVKWEISGLRHPPPMDDFRVGTVIRRIRQARGWRQADLADRAGTSASAVSRAERGQFGPQSLDGTRRIAAALDIRLDLVPCWRGGDLDRLLNRAHSALHESVARTFREEWPAWVLAPEVSFSIYGERGVIDILGWHSGRRALLVIELKTDIVDVNELLGTLDRKRRLARKIASGRGWDAVSVAAWLVIRDSRTNRRRVEAHAAMVAGALPNDRPTVRRWLADPLGGVAGVSFWTDSHGVVARHADRQIRRVRTPLSGPSERERT